MKSTPAKIALFSVILLIVAGTCAWSLQVTTEFEIGNLGFAADRASTATDYPLNFPWGLSLYGSQPISEMLRVDTGFYYDSTLKNISYTLLRYQQQFFTLGVGPFFGLFNSRSSLLKPGISTAVRVDFPGIAFLEFRADSSIGGRMVQAGDYLQERSDITAGFYVLNAIGTVNLFTKSYTYRTDTQEIIDSYVEYSFKTDIYQKNVPFRVLLSFAYQKRGKSYTNIGTQDNAAHELNSLILGTRMDINLSDYLSLMLNLESSIYSFGSADDVLLTLPVTGINAYLFRASTGLTLDVDRLVDRRRAL